MFCFSKKTLKESNENDNTNKILTQILYNIDSLKRDNIISEYKINEKISTFEKNINEKIDVLISKNDELIKKNNKLVEQNKILFDFIIEHFNEEKNKEENILTNLDLQIKKNKVETPMIQEDVIQKTDVQEEELVIQEEELVIQEESVIQEEVVQEEVVQENVVQEEVVQENVAQEEVVQENVAQENVVQEEVVQENVAQENVVQEEVVQENVAQEVKKKRIYNRKKK